MALKSGIFNSVNGDRIYKAEDFAAYFASFIGNGVFPNPSNGFQVIAGTGMSVNLKAGKAWINGYYATNDGDYNLQLDVADGVLNRIDRVVLQLNYLNRTIMPVIKKGTFASTPIAPAIKRDADAYEIALADIRINKGALSISQANITDLRLNTELCGIVHGVVDQVDTTTIFNQYQSWYSQFTSQKTLEFNDFTKTKRQEYEAWSEQQQSDFNTWFASIQDILSGDVAGNILNQIEQVNQRVTDLSQSFTTHNDDMLSHVKYGKATGMNTKSISLTPAPKSLIEGLALSFKNETANTSATTLNVNGLGDKPILKSNGNSLSSGNLKTGSIYTVRYDGTSFILQGEGGEYGTAIAQDVLTGKTLGTENGVVVGTMPNRGTFNLGLGESVPEGYYSGGTTANGKRWRSGTIPGSGVPSDLSISGLPFRPSVITIKNSSSPLFRTILADVANAGDFNSMFFKTLNINSAEVYGTFPYTILPDGFTAMLMSTGSSIWTWTAYE